MIRVWLLTVCLWVSLGCAMEYQDRVLGIEFHDRDLSSVSIENLCALKNMLLKNVTEMRLMLIDMRRSHTPSCVVSTLRRDCSKVQLNLAAIQDAIELKRLLNHFVKIPSLRRTLGLE
jgi:hypothetical protein